MLKCARGAAHVLRVLGKHPGLLRGHGPGPGDDGDAPVRLVDHDVDDPLPLLVEEVGELTRGAHGDECVGAVLDDYVGDAAHSLLIDLLPPGHEGGDGKAEYTLELALEHH